MPFPCAKFDHFYSPFLEHQGLFSFLLPQMPHFPFFICISCYCGGMRDVKKKRLR